MSRLIATLLLVLTLSGVQAQRVGLVLSGGGAVGLTHIGVLQALEENGIPVDYITGSSMGALIGALYATGVSPWEMDSLFRTPKFQLMAQGGVEPIHQYHFKESHPDATMIGIRFNPDTTLQASLPTNLRSPVLMDFEQMVLFAGASAAAGYDLDSLFVPYRCVASDITARRPVVFSKGDLAQAVRASMSYPFYFKPIRIDGHLMMDGGLFNNFPSDVMYDAFLPDIIIGSNVASNDAPPDEDDLMSQIKAMMTAPTNYALPCSDGLIIEPKTSTTLFDFANAAQAVQDGYRSAMARMPEIKALLARRESPGHVANRRAQYKRTMPAVEFGDIRFEGLTEHQALFAERVLNKKAESLSSETLKPRYFRLYADQSVSGLFPRATHNPERGNFDLTVNVRKEKPLEVRFGGMYGSRPINSAMIGIRYNFFGRVSSRLDGLGYFGKFYTAGQVRWRTDLSSRTPIFLEPLFTYNRWDFFRGFNNFFQEVRPSYIVDRERWGGVNVGMALGNKGLLRLDAKYVDSRNSYYQDDAFVAKDTADITDMHFGTWGLTMERNSLNRKQHPNSGELFRAEARLVNGLENSYPGTRSESREQLRTERAWFLAKVTLDKYFAPRGIIRYGLLAEGVYSTQPFLHNYKATLLRAPVFQPTPESRTYFLEDFRATQYVAGGARMIIAVAKEKFDVRLEGYVFQPYRAIKREGFDQASEGTPISDRYFIASGSMIYQSPLGPLWFNTSYIDGLRNPWVWSINFGYVLFAQRAME